MKRYIIFQNKKIEFLVRVNKRAKRIILKVSNSGDVFLTIPSKKFEKQAVQLVQKKAEWVLAHQKKAKQEFDRNSKILDEIQFLGNKYPVELLPNSKRIKIKFKTNKFELHIGNHTYKEVREELKKWYIKQAKRIVPALIENFGYAEKVNQISIRNQKTCWGSCSSKSNLNFNWRLMMAPLEVVNYIVAHELTHLRYMNHSEKFWKEVQKKCPDYKKHKYWIKQNGKLLNL